MKLNRRSLMPGLVASLITATCSVTCSFAANIEYTITDLGGLGGRSNPYAINSSGQVVGSSYSLPKQGQELAFLWTPTTANGTVGTMSNIGPPGPSSTSVAYGINNLGQVTGISLLPNEIGHVFFWDGSTHDIGTLGGGADINDSGLTVGGSGGHAYLFDPTPHDLGTLGGPTSGAYSINNSNQVTGDSYTSPSTPGLHAFLYDGTMHDLGTLGGTVSIGFGISDLGQVVGWSYLDGDRIQHAFLYDGTMHDLGSLFGYGSFANGINNRGQIVGHSYTNGFSITRAFLYTQRDGMVDLNSLIDPASGWVLEYANAINDFGQIVGVGTLGGQDTAFLLTPVPEPSSFALLGIGFLFIACMRVG